MPTAASGAVTVGPAEPSDWAWITEQAGPIGGPQVVSRGVLHTLADHSGLIASMKGVRVGFAVTRAAGDAIELLAILAIETGSGIGSALLEAVERAALGENRSRMWLVTTNDNLSALRFYQRRGYRLEDIRPGAFSEVRRLKGLDPSTEVLGQDGIEIRDEIMLAKSLNPK